MGGLEDDGLPGKSPDGRESSSVQRPMEVDRTKYYETGQLNVAEGPPGTLPVVGGDPPAGPEAGLTAENFVCNGTADRPQCEFYAAVLMPADGVARGYAPMKQIRRFCLKMATGTELFELDGSVFACTLRSPQDPVSADQIRTFEERQRQLAAESAQTSGELDF
jgi:hypothetical protein